MQRLEELLRERAATARTITAPTSARSSAAEAAPVCPVCEGARFVRVTADPDHPDFGRALPCACVVEEDARARRERLLRYSRLGALARFTFDTLQPRGRSSDPAAQDRYAHAAAAARRFADEPRGWLVLSGVPGCGKTHMAAAIANHAIARGTPALFLAVADLLDLLRESYAPDAEVPYERLLEQVRTAPLVVFDDLDAYAPTPWAREKFFQVVSHRFHAALPTVFTCDRAPEEIDTRLGARLTDPSLAQVFVLETRSLPRYSHIGGMTRDRLASFTFAGFRPDGARLQGKQRASLEGAYQAARRFADAPTGWLVLLGATGCGKTHLAAAVASHRLDAGDTVCFANVPDLLDELRASFAPQAAERFDTVFGRLREVPLLVLDDLGAQQASAWAEEKLYQILNHRHLGRMPTVITTNVELGKMEPRIASRLSDLQVSTVHEINAPDFRLGG